MSWSSRIERAYRGRVRKFNVTIAEAALTNAVNGSPQSIAIGAIPAGATILAVAFRLTAQFTGGGATTCVATIGTTAGGVSHLGSAINVLGGTVAPVLYSAPTTPGTVAGPFAAADTINAIFTPDAGHNLAALTTGSIDFEVTYTLGDAGINN